MLVLTRKRDETIKIGNEITIKVIHTGQGSVKLGIEAPADIRVLRGELVEFPATSSLNVVKTSAMNSGEHDNQSFATSISGTQFLMEFDAEYVSDLEDQLLVSTAL